MCLARSTPHTGSSGAQGLWSEFTAKPQLAAPKGSTGPPGLYEDGGLVSRRARRLLIFFVFFLPGRARTPFGRG